MWAGTVTAPGWATSAATLLDDLALEIGGLELQRRARGLEQDVRQDRNGRAALDDAGDMAERPQEFATFDHKPHRRILGTVR